MYWGFGFVMVGTLAIFHIVYLRFRKALISEFFFYNFPFVFPSLHQQFWLLLSGNHPRQVVEISIDLPNRALAWVGQMLFSRGILGKEART